MLYVSIGRNVGDVPMGDSDWHNFVDTVTNVVVNCERVSAPDTKAFGESNWAGMREETCVLVWFDKNSELRGDTIGHLTEVARMYGQEAIAYTVAPTSFVEGV